MYFTAFVAVAWRRLRSPGAVLVSQVLTKQDAHICLCTHIHHFLFQKDGGPADLPWAAVRRSKKTWHLFTMPGLHEGPGSEKLTEPWDCKERLKGRKAGTDKFNLKLKQCGNFTFIPIPFSSWPCPFLILLVLLLSLLESRKCGL